MSDPTAKIPFSEEAEKAVLGAILRDASCLNIAESLLRPEQFFIDVHSRIYQIMISLSAANENVDLITVADGLRANEKDGRKSTLSIWLI